jgi:hypothetical protein
VCLILTNETIELNVQVINNPSSKIANFSSIFYPGGFMIVLSFQVTKIIVFRSSRGDGSVITFYSFQSLSKFS